MDNWSIALIICIAGTLIGSTVQYSITTNELQEEIIKRGYGLYCPTTGNFAFIGECEDITK